MGVHQSGWEKPYLKALKGAYSHYPNLARVEFEDRFDLVPIEYDSIFRTLVERWESDANAVGKSADALDAGLVKDLVGWLHSAAGEEHNFPWTHCGDVILYRLFPAVHDAVTIHVARQLAESIVALNGAPFSVIGYSLGTAVAHDTLHMLWTKSLSDGSNTGFGTGQAHAQVVAMIANVSRVLEGAVDVYNSSVMPGPATKGGRGCDIFLTARHALDPFATPQPFDPLAWPDAKALSRGDYRPVRTTAIHDWNVHAFEHYLENPQVHIPLFRALTFESAISQKAELDAVAAFPELGMPAGEGIAIRQWLESHAPAKSAAWEVLRTIADWYFKGP